MDKEEDLFREEVMEIVRRYREVISWTKILGVLKTALVWEMVGFKLKEEVITPEADLYRDIKALINARHVLSTPLVIGVISLVIKGIEAKAYTDAYKQS